MSKTKPPVEKTNLLHLSRCVDKCLTAVWIEADWETRIEWLTFGEATLVRANGRSENDGRWRLEARMGRGATDFEHDTAFALRLPLVGVEFDRADHHTFHFYGFVDSTLDVDDRHNGFHVPSPGYDPTKHPKAVTCKGIFDEKRKLYCKWNDGKPHVIVPEGFYVPPFDPELYRRVAGKRVKIYMGRAPDAEDET